MITTTKKRQIKKTLRVVSEERNSYCNKFYRDETIFLNRYHCRDPACAGQRSGQQKKTMLKFTRRGGH